jgi:hypothetical protein
MPFLSRQTFMGLGKESTQGTPAAASLFVPVATSVKPADTPTYVDDDSIVANRSKIRQSYQGPIDSTVSYDGFWYPEVIGFHTIALGLVDAATPKQGRTVADGVTTISTNTVTSATANFTAADRGAAITATGIPASAFITVINSATSVQISANATASGVSLSLVIGSTTVYRHPFQLSPTSGTQQPASFSVVDYDAVDAAATRVYPGSVMDSLDLTIDAKGAVKYSAKWMGWPSVTGTAPTAVFPSSAGPMGWQAQCYFAPLGLATAVPRLISGTISLKNGTEAIHTANGLQSPYDVWAGDFEVSIKLKMLLENTSDWRHFIVNDQPPLIITLTLADSISWSCFVSQPVWKSAPSDRSQKWMQFDADITGANNAADGGAAMFVLGNALVTAY